MVKTGTNSFAGGVHPETHKALTAEQPIRPGPRPSLVVLPMVQHLGVPARPVVGPGDTVKVGQVVGEAGGLVSAPVHATVSGRVVAVERRPHPSGTERLAVVIRSDGRDEWAEGPGERRLADLTPEDIRAIAREAGLVGLGGAAFPTHVKLTPPEGQRIDTVILNGCECEPYLTADHRLMLERAETVAYGLVAVVRAVGAWRAVVAVEDNKPGAARALGAALTALEEAEPELVGNVKLDVRLLPTKYPQGAEKQLIWAVTGRAVPPGKLPSEAGCLVQNVGTAAALADAIRLGKPLVERVVTVAGSLVVCPGNYLVRLGTPVREILAFAGGPTGPVGKLILGGPMMGVAQATDAVPVVKGTSGILALSPAEARTPEPRPCLHCGRCVKACPMGLSPFQLARAAEAGFLDEAEQAGAGYCLECGSCAFVCPAKRPLVEAVRRAKAALAARRVAVAKAAGEW
ncbi:MAG TPA: electron transport complex subunit RsxC [Firmicutes bacterium]|nr:electron transport complex subunit RsxC [Bacillota bacterium]